ncbi:MAG TPA: Gfo/Idh/MocA family oxidoreductase [Candidatus Bilamarchaeaceae archaeon]|nr:Gfo/Idh/MocA family oxidoreductase [Candidatus Bilamarchaeaceae archaeon]
MKVGVIGTGYMGKNHLRVYSELRGVDEIYLYDTDKNAAQEAAKQFNAHATDMGELLRQAEAVSVCTPTETHYEIAKRMLENGTHCLIEKPLAVTPEEARRIEALVKKSSAIVGVGHIERFNPAVHEVKRILDKPFYMEMERHNPHFGRIEDTDVISDLMIHDIDNIWNYWFRGKKYRILGAGGIRKKLLELVAVLVDFEGCVVKLSGSRLASTKIRKVMVEQEEKTLMGDLMTQEVYVYKKTLAAKVENMRYSQESAIDKVMISKIEPLRLELKTFLDCAKNSKPFPISVQDAVRALEVADEIRKRAE